MGLTTAFLVTGGVYLLTTLSPLVFPAWRGMDEGAAVGKGVTADKGAAGKGTAADEGATMDKRTAPDKGAAAPLSSVGPIRPTAAPAEPTPHP